LSSASNGFTLRYIFVVLWVVRLLIN
jgi:hypothetical protein